MKQVELDIDMLSGPEDIINILRRREISRPDNVIFSLTYKDKIEGLAQMALLVMFEVVFSVLSKKESGTDLNKRFTEMLLPLSRQFHSSEELETSLEQNWHTSFEWKQKPKAKDRKSPLDEVFGLWKDRDITLTDLRKKAWPQRS